MRVAWTALFLVLGFLTLGLAASPSGSLPADEAMQLLKDGNARYVSGKPAQGRQERAPGAEATGPVVRPVAVVLCCSDARTPAERLLDQDDGVLFVVRVSGGVAGPDALASIDHGVGRLGAPVVLVLGHSGCDAVSATVQNAKFSGNASGLAAQIRPAVAKAREWSPGAAGQDLVEKSVKANVWQSMETILRKSAEVRGHVESGRILLVGAVHDGASGQVTWLGQHPEQGRILTAVRASMQRPKPVPKPIAPAPEKSEAQAREGGAEDAHAPAASVDEAVEKAAEKAAAKVPAKEPAKASAKPAARASAKAPAANAAKTETSQEPNPNARSQGDGELLLPEPEPAAKVTAKAPSKAGAHK